MVVKITVLDFGSVVEMENGRQLNYKECGNTAELYFKSFSSWIGSTELPTWEFTSLKTRESCYCLTLSVPSTSSDDFPVPLALPIYSLVSAGLGWCVERPLSIHCRSGLPLLWSVRPSTRRELRWLGHKHHLPVSTIAQQPSHCFWVL